MSLLIGALNVDDPANGYRFEIIEGGPIDGVAEVRGKRVLIPGRVGLYTPANNFEVERLLIRLKAWVGGSGATHALRVTSYQSLIAALKTACAVSTRADVTLTNDSHTIAAGFLRFEGPPTQLDHVREFVIEFEATATAAWT